MCCRERVSKRLRAREKRRKEKILSDHRLVSCCFTHTHTHTHTGAEAEAHWALTIDRDHVEKLNKNQTDNKRARVAKWFGGKQNHTISDRDGERSLRRHINSNYILISRMLVSYNKPKLKRNTHHLIMNMWTLRCAFNARRRTRAVATNNNGSYSWNGQLFRNNTVDIKAKVSYRMPFRQQFEELIFFVFIRTAFGILFVFDFFVHFKCENNMAHMHSHCLRARIIHKTCRSRAKQKEEKK